MLICAGSCETSERVSACLASIAFGKASSVLQSLICPVSSLRFLDSVCESLRPLHRVLCLSRFCIFPVRFSLSFLLP